MSSLLPILSIGFLPSSSRINLLLNYSMVLPLPTHISEHLAVSVFILFPNVIRISCKLGSNPVSSLGTLLVRKATSCLTFLLGKSLFPGMSYSMNTSFLLMLLHFPLLVLHLLFSLLMFTSLLLILPLLIMILQVLLLLLFPLLFPLP